MTDHSASRVRLSVGSERLDLPRIGMATIVAAGLALGLAFVFVRHAQSTSHVGPTSATLDEAFSLLAGAALGLGLGGAVGALVVRHGPRALSGMIVGLLAYLVVLPPPSTTRTASSCGGARVHF